MHSAISIQAGRSQALCLGRDDSSERLTCRSAKKPSVGQQMLAFTTKPLRRRSTATQLLGSFLLLHLLVSIYGLCGALQS